MGLDVKTLLYCAARLERIADVGNVVDAFRQLLSARGPAEVMQSPEQEVIAEVMTGAAAALDDDPTSPPNRLRSIAKGWRETAKRIAKRQRGQRLAELSHARCARCGQRIAVHSPE